MTNLNVNAGDIIRHNSRGSEYEVIGKGIINSMDQQDSRTVKRGFKNDDVTVPVRQASTRLPGGTIGIIYYRAFVSKPGEPWLFSRPVPEFTSDRFTIVSRSST